MLNPITLKNFKAMYESENDYLNDEISNALKEDKDYDAMEDEMNMRAERDRDEREEE